MQSTQFNKDLDRYELIIKWAMRRYTKNNVLIVEIGRKPTIYSRIAESAYMKYVHRHTI